MVNKTLDYYNKNGEDFFRSTVNVDVSGLYEAFERYLPQQGKIMDLGCGSGRDSKYFLGKGYLVVSVDGSETMCRLASEYLGQAVIHKQFSELDYEQEFEGIWANASLLHIEKDALPAILIKIAGALKSGGILYTSFKYGEEERIKDGRHFSDFTKTSIYSLFKNAQNLKLETCFLTRDVRQEKGDAMWVNIIVKKCEEGS